MFALIENQRVFVETFFTATILIINLTVYNSILAGTIDLLKSISAVDTLSITYL